MSNSVIIKGNKYGIVVVMDENIPFLELKECVREKFESASKFFDKANMAISFEGRKLSVEEQKELVNLITEITELNIVCIVDNDPETEENYKIALEAASAKSSSENHSGADFYKGTLRSGQVLERDNSLIIFGDVNPGANVISKGNVIILGSCKGMVYAGADGNANAFVIALEMAPIQIRIGDVIARSNDQGSRPKEIAPIPKIAFVDDNNIYIEKYDKDIMNEIRI